MSSETKLLLTHPTLKGVIVTAEVSGKVPGKDHGLGVQHRSKEQALISRISTTAHGHYLGGRVKEAEGERTHFSFG